jgi:hypothetical protein
MFILTAIKFNIDWRMIDHYWWDERTFLNFPDYHVTPSPSLRSQSSVQRGTSPSHLFTWREFHDGHLERSRERVEGVPRWVSPIDVNDDYIAVLSTAYPPPHITTASRTSQWITLPLLWNSDAANQRNFHLRNAMSQLNGLLYARMLSKGHSSDNPDSVFQQGTQGGLTAHMVRHWTAWHVLKLHF